MPRVRYDWKGFHAELKRTVVEQLDCIELLHQRGNPSAKPAKPGTCWAHCPAPDHPDNHPSCLVHTDRFYCFACEAKGDIFELLGLLFELPASASFSDKVKAGLEALGVDYEEEKQRFIELERARHARPSSSPSSPEDTPAPTYRAPQGTPAPRPVQTSSPQNLEAHKPAPSSLHQWQAMLDGLKLEDEEVAYLEEERGLPASLCRAVGMVSTTREAWLERLTALEARYDVETCLESGLFRRAREASTTSALIGHPYASRMLLLPYGFEGKLEGLRFRQTGACLDHQGARYLALLGRQNAVTSPYLADAWGRACLPPVGHRGTLYVCEGELDALSLVSLGRAAIGIPGARAWRAEWGEHWPEHYAHLVLWADDDASTKKASDLWLAQIARDLAQMHGDAWVSTSVHITSARQYPGCKDANDLLVLGQLEAHLDYLERDILDKTTHQE